MRKLVFVVGLLFSFTLIGMIGFRLTEGWDWLQCLYEAIIIMTTVGLSATNQASLKDVTKAFIIVYLIFGVGIFTLQRLATGAVSGQSATDGAVGKASHATSDRAAERAFHRLRFRPHGA